MQAIQLIRDISLLFILLFVSCNRQNQNGKEDVMYMDIVIRNYTDDIIYLNSYYGLSSVDYKEQEKIYYCSTPLYFVYISHDKYSFVDIINNSDEKEIRIEKGFIIDYAKYRYEPNDDGRVSKIYEGECDTVSFRLFYTKIPLSGVGYGNYKDAMKAYGHYAVGYHNDDKIFFDIHTHTKINEDVSNGDVEITDTKFKKERKG